MQDSPIRIGSISLQGFEIPTSVRFGGRYRLAVHNLSGGKRILERLGPDDGDVSFHGTFSGANAEARVRTFDDLRLSGATVWLTWETFRRQVVVKNFVAEYHSPWWISYKVSCIVAYQVGVQKIPESNLFALISSDFSNALAALSGSAVSLGTLQAAIFSPNAMTSGTLAQAQASAAVGTTIQAINGQITFQSGLITSQGRHNLGPSSADHMLSSMVSSTGLLAAAVNARSYVGRIGTNLTGGWGFA